MRRCRKLYPEILGRHSRCAARRLRVLVANVGLFTVRCPIICCCFFASSWSWQYLCENFLLQNIQPLFIMKKSSLILQIVVWLLICVVFSFGSYFVGIYTLDEAIRSTIRLPIIGILANVAVEFIRSKKKPGRKNEDKA